MKKHVVVAAMLGVVLSSGASDAQQAAAPGGGGGGLGYTCSDPMGSPKTCTCTSAADCWWMGVKGVCGKVVVMTCKPDGSPPCTCDWNAKVTPEVPLGLRLRFNGSDILSP